MDYMLVHFIIVLTDLFRTSCSIISTLSHFSYRGAVRNTVENIAGQNIKSNMTIFLISENRRIDYCSKYCKV